MIKKIFKRIVLFSLSACLLLSTNALASSSGTRYINSTYGYLTGTTNGFRSYDEKVFNTSARTTNNVSRIRSSLEVRYYSTGAPIGSGENTYWIYNSNAAYTSDYEMHHFYNSQTGRYDGFITTTLTAYGTADAIVDVSYVVYTNTTV